MQSHKTKRSFDFVNVSKRLSNRCNKLEKKIPIVNRKKKNHPKHADQFIIVFARTTPFRFQFAVATFILLHRFYFWTTWHLLVFSSTDLWNGLKAIDIVTSHARAMLLLITHRFKMRAHVWSKAITSDLLMTNKIYEMRWTSTAAQKLASFHLPQSEFSGCCLLFEIHEINWAENMNYYLIAWTLTAQWWHFFFLAMNYLHKFTSGNHLSNDERFGIYGL